MNADVSALQCIENMQFFKIGLILAQKWKRMTQMSTCFARFLESILRFGRSKFHFWPPVNHAHLTRRFWHKIHAHITRISRAYDAHFKFSIFAHFWNKMTHFQNLPYFRKKCTVLKKCLVFKKSPISKVFFGTP